MSPEDLVYGYLKNGNFGTYMMSSEVVHTHHHIRGFLRKSLVLRIKPNTGQTLGTTDKRERRKHMAKSIGGPFWLLRL